MKGIILKGNEGVERIKREVAFEFGIFPEKVFLKTRKRAVLDPYYAAFKLMEELMGLDVKAIMAIAGRDRTCYYHTADATSNLYETDKGFRERVDRIIERITNEEIEKSNVQ